MRDKRLQRKIHEGYSGKETEKKEKELRRTMTKEQRMEFHRGKEKEMKLTEKVGGGLLQSEIREMIREEKRTGEPVEHQAAKRKEEKKVRAKKMEELKGYGLV